MLRRWLERGRLPIGVDLGARHVRAAQLSRWGRRWRVSAAGVRLLPADLPVASPEHLAAQASALKDILASTPFKGRRAVSALPSSLVQYKNLRLPPMPPHEQRTAVEWEAADRLKLGQKFQIQFYDAGEVRQGEELRQEIVLLAAPNDAVEQHVALLVDCGLELDAIDAAPGALARWAAAAGPHEPEDAQLILDLGATGSSVLICRHGRVTFFKRIELGGHHLEEAVAHSLSTTTVEAAVILAHRARDPQAAAATLPGASRREGAAKAIGDAVRPVLTDLAREVGLCLRYHSVTFRGHKPQTALLTGGGAGDPLLPQVIVQETGMTALPLGAGAAVDFTQMDEAVLAASAPSTWAVAAGLSMRCRRQLTREAA